MSPAGNYHDRVHVDDYAEPVFAPEVAATIEAAIRENAGVLAQRITDKSGGASESED